MKSIVIRLHKAFDLTADLVDAMSTANLNSKLKGLPSNTIGEQLWCIIGGRESYLNAIIHESWKGFSSSLEDATSKTRVLECLEKSKEDCLTFLNEHDLNEKQIEYLLLLLEHEIQHHGQLIRYFYGNGIKFPKSWNERYTV